VPEPKSQVEIQLGHMCNNRCVFCVSGQQTELRRAGPMPARPILDQLERAFASGQRKVTLLGGEPTLQPGFFEIVRHAVELGFEEIVIFSNGVKTARASFIDEVLGLGGNLTWRISIQGANKLAHERTTRRPGSFERIAESMRLLADRGQRITVNMCVVQSNFESVGEFPELLLPFGVSQLHLDMVRPLDAGERTEEEFRAMIPRYSEMVPHLERMIRGFPEGFDVNIGNLPYCIAPELARWIHHDGEQTLTIAVDGERELSAPWDKYLVKRRDKLKPERCGQCVFEPRCSGIFEKYREIHGDAELSPVSPERLRMLDPELRLLGVHLVPVVRALDGWQAPAPFRPTRARVSGDAQARVTLGTGEHQLEVELKAPGGGVASFDLFSLHLLSAPRRPELAREGLAALWTRLEELGHRVLHPLGPDALPGALTPPLAARVQRLRRSVPFGEARWTGIAIAAGGRRAELTLAGAGGELASVWLADEGGRVRGGYELSERPSPGILNGVGALMRAIGART
jgi:MoaA/NifB/PqqE/SkfB family radical SAM enzyme